MTTQILRDVWCEDLPSGNAVAPGLWRSLAKFEQVLRAQWMQPVRIVTFEREVEADKVLVHMAVECEPGQSNTPFWKWWFRQDMHLSCNRVADDRSLPNTGETAGIRAHSRDFGLQVADLRTRAHAPD